MDSGHLLQLVEVAFELVGVSALVIGTVLALIRSWEALRHAESRSKAYRSLRQDIGRAIMVGLEFLVAADIIRSVALEPTFVTVGVLGLIVVVRTFLSWSLEVEITGEWPWRHARSAVTRGRVEELGEL